MKALICIMILMNIVGCSTHTTILSDSPNVWVTEHSTDGASDRVFYCISRKSDDGKKAYPICVISRFLETVYEKE